MKRRKLLTQPQRRFPGLRFTLVPVHCLLMNNHRITLLTASALFLSACSPSPVAVTDIESETLNPLTAIQYGNELADTLADIIIQKDPLLETPGTEEMLQNQITNAKSIVQAGKDAQSRGRFGPFIEIDEYVSGNVLYVDNRLYFSPSFVSDPGLSLHVYLTQAVDPREGVFPDATAIDLGEIQTVYGPQTYVVPEQENPDLYRMVVLWDTEMERLYGFAQIDAR